MSPIGEPLGPTRRPSIPSLGPAVHRRIAEDGRVMASPSSKQRLWKPMTGLLSMACLIASASVLASGNPDGTRPPVGMVTVPAGVYQPPFRSETDAKEVPVRAFALDRLPVTNGDFLGFVRADPRWCRSQVKRLFADANYLADWTGDLQPGGSSPADSPVTQVSWFAAKAYASWKGRRLPTTAEWELAAAASPTRPDGENDVDFQRQIAAWHSAPAPGRLPAVGGGRANCFGVQDLHGLAWEWVSDFNTAMVTGDARGDAGLERRLFCGSGSQAAKNPSDYAVFLRFGLRSSLQAPYAVHNLGFRCAQDLPGLPVRPSPTP